VHVETAHIHSLGLRQVSSLMEQTFLFESSWLLIVQQWIQLFVEQKNG
jgi:hypothetical protein